MMFECFLVKNKRDRSKSHPQPDTNSSADIITSKICGLGEKGTLGNNNTLIDTHTLSHTNGISF